MIKEGTAVLAPTFGPAMVTAFGIDVPLAAMGLSVGGLLLARMIAPPPLRKLNRSQEAALTMLLMIILFLIVTGSLGNGQPLGPGIATVWGIGLGLSGLLAIEFFGQRVMAMLRALMDAKGER